MEIGKFNRRITVKSWGTTQDIAGGVTAIQTASYTMWAKVEPRNGRLFTGQDQSLWNYDYKVTFRYERSRIVASNMTIDYDGKRLAINSISFEDEGNRKYAVARCSTTDSLVSNGEIGVPDSLRTLDTFDYYGVGSETEWTEPTLIGKKIIGAFKDGVEFQVIITGVPVGKQVLYDTTIGKFTWGIAYSLNEHTLIQYL